MSGTSLNIPGPRKQNAIIEGKEKPKEIKNKEMNEGFCTCLGSVFEDPCLETTHSLADVMFSARFRISGADPPSEEGR